MQGNDYHNNNSAPAAGRKVEKEIKPAKIKCEAEEDFKFLPVR